MSRHLVTRRGELAREGTWALVDQVLSSGTNFVPSIVLARFLGPENYGTFSLAFLAWFFALSVLRTAFMQPYTLVGSSLEASAWRELTKRASGLVVVAGTAAAACFVIAGIIAGASTELGGVLFAVAVLAPGLALQEFWRVASFASRRARTAAANDAYWAVGQTLAFVVLFLTTRVTAAECILAWGAGAWLGAGLGTVQLSVVPRIGRGTFQLARQWLRVGVWFTGANVTFSAGQLGVATIVAAVAGSHQLGLFRMVQGNLFGPVQLVLIGAELVFFPHVVRSLRSASSTGVRAALRYSVILASIVALYGGVLLLAAPVLLSRVFGPAFAPASTLVLPMLVVFTLDASGNGAAVLLRSHARGRGLLTMQIVATSVRLLAAFALIRPFGVVGAAWGLAIGSVVSAGSWWTLVASATVAERRRGRVGAVRVDQEVPSTPVDSVAKKWNKDANERLEPDRAKPAHATIEPLDPGASGIVRP
jgi:O-antigen/teichoic acid export membrane protein